ncbi:ABC transporter substrate-binding protein [Paraburkholderia sp. BL9I2N2]|uniref:ABC transporter substrate-binding protein n=1 Tax=Paraburkholderia sp. BL9I2N2 TaxID=1938809 RepID=UPI001FB2396C|nr:ABC transporter substrate-binding protein [Paraburkholderia sp. BL9I2N2]
MLARIALGSLAIATILAPQVSLGQSPKGDVITDAIVGEPPTLDPMTTTADVVVSPSEHIFETLFTFDSQWRVRPLLAESMPTISGDGLTYIIPIRKDVIFQDGSKMTSDDVVASLARWERAATSGKEASVHIDGIRATNDHTVTIKLKEPFTPLLSLLAKQVSAAVIVPKANIKGDQLTKLIGTGPYRLAEHKPDQYIKLSRFTGYVSRKEPSDGTFGERKQIVKEIDFIPVPDNNTRVEGAVAGQYDYVDGLPIEAYGRLEKSDRSKPVLLRDASWPFFAFNMRAGLMSHLKLRQAVAAALCPEDMLLAAFSDKKFYSVDAALYPTNYRWHSEEGAQVYNQHNAQKASSLLKEGGYNGAPLRILTSHQYEFHYQMAEVAKACLEEAGFRVQLDVVDWATLTQRRGNPKLWDIYITHSSFNPEPATLSAYYSSAPMGWDTPERTKVWDAFLSATDEKKREQAFAQVQKLVWDQLPFYKVGSFAWLAAENRTMTGVPKIGWPVFWNAKVSK